MSATVKIDPDWDIPVIVEAAGGSVTRTPADTFYVTDGDTLVVPDVEQAALDRAVRDYDHAAVEVQRDAEAAKRTRLASLAGKATLTAAERDELLREIVRLLLGPLDVA